MSHDLPKIKNIILIDKIKLFSDKTDAPEWVIPVPFQDGNKITKKFLAALHYMIKNEHKLFFISEKANIFLKKYLENNINDLKKFTKSEHNTDFIQKSLLKRTIVLEKNYNKKHTPTVFSFDEINQFGESLLADGNTEFSNISKNALPEDLVTIIYTSGTTANPKGVMLTHSNFMHNLRVLPPTQELNKDDRWLSVLPSWHIFERTAEYLVLTIGAMTAYSKPYKQVLLPDLITIKPTVMISVPRIWESVYRGIMDKVKKGSTLKRIMFNWAIKIGEEYKKANGVLENRIPLFDRSDFTPEEKLQAKRIVKKLSWQYQLADKLVFKKIREVTGGELRFAISGGGALQKNIDIFYDIAGIMVCEGYGLTETAPCITARNPNNWALSTIGVILPEVEIKIVDKDNHDKELLNSQTGILLIKGPMVMKGYYKNEEKTKEIIKEGWFDSGDLGRKTYDGKYLQIVGRIKDTIVLSGGENIEPHSLEDKFKESEYVNMIIMVGQDKPRLGALIVPDFDALSEYAQINNITFKDPEELIQKPEIISLYQKEQKRLISKKHGFKSFETVMGIGLLLNEFTVEAGDLTETLKMKRFEIHKKYQEEIDEICG
jgi:long-subunit acyl-CoA synthetase (AMP-forming)